MRASVAKPERCPFCFPAAIDPQQLLVATESFYLLAPRGQIVEGYLSITTHVCADTPHRLRCIDDVPDAGVDDLERLRDLVTRFYAETYRAPPVFYEHGRGGGTRSTHVTEGFAFHPHLCALPGPMTIHEPLQDLGLHPALADFPRLRTAIGRRPYFYVHTPGDPASPAPTAYVAAETVAQEHIQRVSIKRLLVDVNGLEGEWDWRVDAPEERLDSVCARFRSWYARTYHFARQTVREHVSASP